MKGTFEHSALLVLGLVTCAFATALALVEPRALGLPRGSRARSHR